MMTFFRPTRPPRARTTVLLGTGVLVAALVGGAAPPVAAAALTTGTAAPTITWAPCKVIPDDAPTLECGTLQAPLDYRDPGGEKVTLAVSRVKAKKPAERIGSLVNNPGGPGGPGTKLPVYMSNMPSYAKLADRFDLVGFDPRGTGAS